MKILSITFHTTEVNIPMWEQYLKNDLALLIESLIDKNIYILSDIETKMLSEGKNYNLLLFFDNEKDREYFSKTEFQYLEEQIFNRFGDNVMIFKTFINPLNKLKI